MSIFGRTLGSSTSIFWGALSTRSVPSLSHVACVTSWITGSVDCIAMQGFAQELAEAHKMICLSLELQKLGRRDAALHHSNFGCWSHRHFGLDVALPTSRTRASEEGANLTRLGTASALLRCVAS